MTTVGDHLAEIPCHAVISVPYFGCYPSGNSLLFHSIVFVRKFHLLHPSSWIKRRCWAAWYPCIPTCAHNTPQQVTRKRQIHSSQGFERLEYTGYFYSGRAIRCDSSYFVSTELQEKRRLYKAYLVVQIYGCINPTSSFLSTHASGGEVLFLLLQWAIYETFTKLGVWHSLISRCNPL